jgi:hypothetical protein
MSDDDMDFLLLVGTQSHEDLLSCSVTLEVSPPTMAASSLPIFLNEAAADRLVCAQALALDAPELSAKASEATDPASIRRLVRSTSTARRVKR